MMSYIIAELQVIREVSGEDEVNLNQPETVICRILYLGQNTPKRQSKQYGPADRYVTIDSCSTSA